MKFLIMFSYLYLIKISYSIKQVIVGADCKNFFIRCLYGSGTFIVPAISDDHSDLEQLGGVIKKLKNVKKIEVLPYHKLGVYKW